MAGLVPAIFAFCGVAIRGARLAGMTIAELRYTGARFK